MPIGLHKVRRILGVATLLTSAAILYLGLWPYSIRPSTGNHPAPFTSKWTLVPPNEVAWIRGGPGLHFGDFGSIFSATDFAERASGSTGCTFEVWLAPAATEDFSTTLAFSEKNNPLRFRLRQLEDSLAVSRDWLDEKRHMRTERIWVDHVFQQEQGLLITLSAGEGGTSVYLNGELHKRFPNFKMKTSDFAGKFVFGNSPLGREAWSGDLRGMALYGAELSAESIEQHFKAWSSGAKLPPETSASAIALYEFKEGTGGVSRSTVAGAPDLYIPAKFQVMRPIFLEPFWKEPAGNDDYWVDTFLNLAVFVPFGFLIYGYMKKGLEIEHALRRTIAAGFLLSLTIEIAQYFLPMRSSGTTNLIANTAGALIGALLFRTRPVRHQIRKMIGKPVERKSDEAQVRETAQVEQADS